MQSGSLLIDSSTIAPDEARGVASLSKDKSAEFIDAPVSGGNGHMGVCVYGSMDIAYMYMDGYGGLCEWR